MAVLLVAVVAVLLASMASSLNLFTKSLTSSSAISAVDKVARPSEAFFAYRRAAEAPARSVIEECKPPTLSLAWFI